MVVDMSAPHVGPPPAPPKGSPPPSHSPFPTTKGGKRSVPPEVDSDRTPEDMDAYLDKMNNTHDFPGFIKGNTYLKKWSRATHDASSTQATAPAAFNTNTITSATAVWETRTPWQWRQVGHSSSTDEHDGDQDIAMEDTDLQPQNQRPPNALSQATVPVTMSHATEGLSNAAKATLVHEFVDHDATKMTEVEKTRWMRYDDILAYSGDSDEDGTNSNTEEEEGAVKTLQQTHNAMGALSFLPFLEAFSSPPKIHTEAPSAQSGKEGHNHPGPAYPSVGGLAVLGNASASSSSTPGWCTNSPVFISSIDDNTVLRRARAEY
ncbi:hypothetical protein OF83DRAFT_1089548, partial [Amylostereum chailletii]